MRAAWMILAPVFFLATIPAANWMIANVGTKCIPDGPCLVPVWPGILAPSGVLLIGLALALRDVVRELHGTLAVFVLIIVGAIASEYIAPPEVAIASGVAFLLSEGADLLVYEPLRRRGLALAVICSGVVGAVVDSVLFLLIAFGSLQYLAGQLLGKVWMTLLAGVVIALVHFVGRRAPG